MKKTIESKAADSILQRPQELEIGGKKYTVAPPTVATLILVSELVAQMPKVELNAKRIVSESLFIAKDCRVLGDILAVLILGAKQKKRLFGLLSKSKRRAKLAETILMTLSPSQVNTLTAELLTGMEISDFFGFTTSLIEINLTRPTKGVV